MQPFRFAVYLAASIGFAGRTVAAQHNSISLAQAVEVPKDALNVRPSNRSQAIVGALNVVDILRGRALECPSAYVECYGLGTCCPGYSMSVRCCPDGTCKDPGDECCSGGGMCPYREKCCGDDGCAPTGSVCCGSDHYCEAGDHCVLVDGVQRCCETYNCRGSGGGSDEVDEESTTTTTAITTSSSSTTSTSGIETSDSGQSGEYIYYYSYITWYYYITSYTIYVSPVLTTDTTTETITTYTRVSLQATDSDEASLEFGSLSRTMVFPTPTEAKSPIMVTVTESGQGPTSIVGIGAPSSSSISGGALPNLSTETRYIHSGMWAVAVLALPLAAYLAWL